MKNIIIIILCILGMLNCVLSQDIELTEGSLKLTTFLGLGLAETATISNDFGELHLDPSPGDPVRITAPHDFIVENGEVQLLNKSELRFISTGGPLMSMNLDTITSGLQILRNGLTVGLYIDKDEDYLSIGKNPIFHYATGQTHFEINQGPGKKALTINQTTGTDYWEMGIDGSTDNLRLYLNGTFMGEFSSLDGSYNPVVVLPRSLDDHEATNDEKSFAKVSKLENTYNNQYSEKYADLQLLLDKISTLESRISELESKN